MSTTFNMFDLIFVVGSFIFVLVAFFRGFVKELFALLNWIVAISLSYLVAPYATKFIEHYSSNKLIVNVVSGSLVFVIFFILVALATRGLARDWKDKMPENLDRILGVFYGVFKSLLIFGLLYSITTNFYSLLLGEIKKEKAEHITKEEMLPDWLAQAKCFPVVEFAGKIIDPIVNKAIDGMATNFLENIDIKPAKIEKEELDEKVDEVLEDKVEEVGGSAGALAEKKSGEKYDDKGYSKKEIEKMNRLIEIVN